MEAWAPTREECIEHAVLGLVESFADTAGIAAAAEHALMLPAEDDMELLVAALDEVIYLLDARGAVAVGVTARRHQRGGLDLRYATVALEDVETIGPVPKGVTRHRLRFGDEDGVWRCSVVIDV